jgi:hypothetical protein
MPSAGFLVSILLVTSTLVGCESATCKVGSAQACRCDDGAVGMATCLTDGTHEACKCSTMGKTIANANALHDQIGKDLGDLDKKTDALKEAIKNAKTEKERKEKEQELAAVVAERKRDEEAAHQKRITPVTISKECQQNPLAKGC